MSRFETVTVRPQGTLWQRLKGMLPSLPGRNKVIQALVSRLDQTRIEGQPEIYSLLRRYVGDTYSCVSLLGDAVADACSPQLWAKTPSGTRVGNFPTRSPNGHEMKNLHRLGITKGNLIDVVGTENVQQVMEHPILDLLMNPNPLLTMNQQFKITQIYQSLGGTAYWYKVRRGGQVVEVWPLPPAPMRYKLDRRSLVDHWIYGSGTHQVKIDPKDIIYFHDVSPLDLIKGYSPLRGTLTASDASVQLMEYEKALLTNRAVPDLIMTVRGRLSKEKVAEHRALWNEQFEEGGNGGLGIIPGDDAKITPLAFRPKDIEIVKSWQQMRETICSAFKIPVSMLTMESSNRAVAEAGLYQMAMFALRPAIYLISGVLNKDLVPEFEDNKRLMIGFPDPVPENEELVIKERESNIRIGFTTPNEERQRAGLPPHPDGDELRSGMNEPSDAERQNPNDSATRVRAVPRRLEAQKEVASDIPGSTPQSVGMEEVLVGLFEQLRSVALDNSDRILKQFEEEGDFEHEEWIALFALAMLPFYKVAALEGVRGGKRVLVERGDALPASLIATDGSFTDKRMEVLSRRAASSVIRTTARELRSAIRSATTAVTGGGAAPTGTVAVVEAPVDIRRAVDGAINKVFTRAVDTRSAAIARTETKRAVEEGRRETYAQAGVERIKWVSTLDARTCEHCRKMNGTIVGIKEPFVQAKDGVLIGTEGRGLPLTFGDVFSPPLHPHCRCILVPE